MLVQATRPVRLECVVRGYVFGGGVEGVRAERGTVGGFAVPAGLAAGRAAAGAAVHADDEGRVGPRPAAHRRRGDRARRRRRATSSCATCRSGSTSSARATRESVRRDPRRHEVRVRRARRRDPRDRRDDDARLVALLARRGRTGRARRRRRSTSSTCATSWTATGWDHEPPAPRMPADVDRRTRAPSTSRRTSCSPARASTTGTAPMTERPGNTATCAGSPDE